MGSEIIVLGFQEEPFDSGQAFVGPTKAEDFLESAYVWQESGLLEIDDAVIALRGKGGGVEIKQTKSLTGKYALGGSGVGLLAGLLLGGPIGGLVGGAAVGAIAGKMKDYGIDDKFVKETSQALAPNTSVLFLMGKSSDPEKLLEEMRPFQALVATTTLTSEQEAELKQALS